jgi:hypothetical protein
MKLPVQQIQKDAAKCLILLGSRGQKTGKTVFGVELGGAGPFPTVVFNHGSTGRGDNPELFR